MTFEHTSIDEQFVSDAWNTLDPKPTASGIVEMWLDQVGAPRDLDARIIEGLEDQVRYYLPANAN